MDFDDAISKAEELREAGLLHDSLSTLNSVILQATVSGDFRKIVSALCHRILVWRIYYIQQDNQNFLPFILGDATAADTLAQKDKDSAELRATAQLRLGDYHLLVNKPGVAIPYLQNALAMIGDGRNGRHAEFRSFLGFADFFFKRRLGLAALSESLAELRASEIYSGTMPLRDWHRDIIESGILLRQIEAFHRANLLHDRDSALDECRTICNRLSAEEKFLRARQLSHLQRQLAIQ